MLQVKWVSWMTGVAMPSIPPEMNYSDIIIPTLDLVRGSFVLEMLLTNNKKVCRTHGNLLLNEYFDRDNLSENLPVEIEYLPVLLSPIFK